MITDHSRISIITHASKGISNRKIDLELGVSRNTVARELNDDQKVAKKRPAWYSNLDTDFIIKKYKHFGSAVNLHQNMIEESELYWHGSACNISIRSVHKQSLPHAHVRYKSLLVITSHCLLP